VGKSPSHRFGQIIGEVFESAVEPLLQSYADKNGLFLDKKGPRPCRTGRKCSWIDENGNKHDLDYVLERDGTPQKQGAPIAFIEAAWRRYTKHSRNKAQEIQGALIPLAHTYRHIFPFKGAILAGVFTSGSLAQLRSLGFTILHFPYEMVADVFKKFGIDAVFDEDTPDNKFQKEVDAYDLLPPRDKRKLADALIGANSEAVEQFMGSLKRTIARTIECVIILPLHGQAKQLGTVEDAIQFVRKYDVMRPPSSVERYEIEIRYSNGDVITGKFKDKPSAVEFLQSYRVEH
jgi:hypothetical protein